MARFLTIALILCTWLGYASGAMALAHRLLTQPVSCCAANHHHDSCQHQKQAARLHADSPTITAVCGTSACSAGCPGGAACTESASSTSTALPPQAAAVLSALAIQVDMGRMGDTPCLSRSSAFRLERPPKV